LDGAWQPIGKQYSEYYFTLPSGASMTKTISPAESGKRPPSP
jgi:hypothetical protein